MWVDIGHGGGGSLAVPLGELIERCTVLFLAIHIKIAGDAHSRRRLKISSQMGKGLMGWLTPNGPPLRMIDIVIGVVIFGFFEIGQVHPHTPSLTAQLPPFIIIQRITTGINLGVQR